MNFKQIREANKLIDEIKKLDSFTMDIQNPERTLKVYTPFDEVTIKKEYRAKVIQMLLEMRGKLAEKLEKLGVTEYDNND